MMFFPQYFSTFLVISCFCLYHVHAYDNGLAATPPKGWTTWCTNDLCGLRDICTEREVERMVDAMVNNGMLSAGYEWILLDDCWSDYERDVDGNLQADKSQFPRGMSYLADYVHRHGMKLGIYTCIGTETCRRNRPGSYGYYQQDANTMATWGIDMVKTDYCNKPGNESGQELYTTFSNALNATGERIMYGNGLVRLRRCIEYKWIIYLSGTSHLLEQGRGTDKV